MLIIKIGSKNNYGIFLEAIDYAEKVLEFCEMMINDMGQNQGSCSFC
jgi:hypothetical protein